MRQPSVTVIGTGALGSTLAKALHKKDYPIHGLFNRSINKAKVIAKGLDVRLVSAFPSSKTELGTIVFITVQDSNIKQVISRLSNIADDFSGLTVVHCSGSEPAAILEAIKRKGAKTAAFHPLQTFNAQSGVQDFKNIYFDVEADGETFAMFKEVATSLGAGTLKISAEAKPYLHAAAVMASNYFVALMDASGQVASLGGMDKDEALEALLPLVSKTLEHVKTEDTLQALTGPVKRGDAETVRKHLQLLEQDRKLLNLYKKLGLQTLQIAIYDQKFSEQKLAELYELLKQDE